MLGISGFLGKIRYAERVKISLRENKSRGRVSGASTSNLLFQPRQIHKTSISVILISSVDKKKAGFVYHDHWTPDGDYIYSGEGKTGDQTMSSGNRAIVNATAEGKAIHLFVKFSSQEYYYQGVFEFISYTYEDDVDENGNTRKEYKFRFRKVN